MIRLSRKNAVGRARGLRAFLALVAFLAAGSATAADSTDVLERARALEAEGMTSLSAHYRFEEALLSEDNDRIAIFLSMPHGARVILDEINVIIDGKSVHRHVYGVNELLMLQGRASQPLYLSRIVHGDHTIKIEIKTMQGKVLPMLAPYAFSKGRTAKYFEILLSGAPARQIDLQEW
jgi:hypothetical protein